MIKKTLRSLGILKSRIGRKTRETRSRKLFLEDLEDRRLLAANLAPVNSVPSEVQTTRMSHPLAFTSFRENLISTSDADAGQNPVQVTLTAEHGKISLYEHDPNGGLTYSVGDGTQDDTMTFSGKLSDINQALQWVIFWPTGEYVGEASITITTNDNGYLGTGGAKEDTDTISINVTEFGGFEDSPTWTLSLIHI